MTSRPEPIRNLRADHSASTTSDRHGAGLISTVLSVKFLAVALFRLSQLLGSRTPLLGSALKQFNHLLTGADVAFQARVGGGLQLFHPTGVVIGPYVQIGEDCRIQGGVILGHADTKRGSGSPTIGNHVEVGAGAIIVGPYTIGDNARIAAGAVVTADVPAGAIARGVPARTL